MKKRIGWAALGLATWATAAGAFPTAIQQQGRLLDGTNLYNGTATIAYRLYDVAEAGAALAGATSEVVVVDGLYAAELDLDPATWATVLTNAELYLETEIDGTPLAPRERIGAVAYARLAAGVTNGAIGELQLAAGAVTEDKLDAGAVTATKIGLGAVSLEKLGGNSVNSGKIVDGSVTADDVEANAFWQTDGNTAVASGSFIGTTDGASFEIRCRDEAVYRADTPLTMAGTTIRMGQSNTVAFAPGGVLAGGFLNRIGDNNYNVVLGGGTLNIINDEASASVLAGGYSNSIGTHAYQSTRSGGLGNMIGTAAEMAVIAGGEMNAAWGSRGTIGGGASNEVAGARSVVSGGSRNQALAADAAIGGGNNNVVSNGALGAFIGGGGWNACGYPQAFIGGGAQNRASGHNGVIGGGLENEVTEQLSTVGGGANNFAGGGNGWATVGGGYFNRATGTYATVAGGTGNRATTSGFVGGGEDNRMNVGSRCGVIAGGEDNVIEATQTHNTIGGGKGNYATASSNTIAGGASNVLFAPFGSIGGGFNNFSQGSYGTVAGGGDNYIDGIYGAIGGGWDNYVASGAAVAGGMSNGARGTFSAIPGGYSNSTYGLYSLAAGFRASADHDGSFVWSDASTNEPFGSTAVNQFSVRAANGLRVVGTTNLGSLTVTPLNSGGDQDAEIVLTETEQGGYGTVLKHDGGLNQFQIFGKNLGGAIGPHLVVTRDSGLVGVGRTPTTNPLEVEGDASKTVAGNWLANSDARIKTDVRPLENALDTLAKLRPVAFRYTAEHRAKHPSIEDRDYNNFIAQEYREVFPDAVQEDGEGLLMVDTYDVQPYLVRAAQELAAAVADLRQENADLKRRLEALEAAQP